MKTSITRITACSAAWALALAIGSVHAHESPGHGMKGAAMMGQHQPGDRIIKALNLEGSRAEQVRAIMTQAQQERRAVWMSMADKKGDEAARQAARDKMRAIGEATRSKLAQVLTPEEVKKLREMRGGKGMGHGPKQG